jgi:hypothetical protein
VCAFCAVQNGRPVFDVQKGVTELNRGQDTAHTQLLGLQVGVWGAGHQGPKCACPVSCVQSASCLLDGFQSGIIKE